MLVEGIGMSTYNGSDKELYKVVEVVFAKEFEGEYNPLSGFIQLFYHYFWNWRRGEIIWLIEKTLKERQMEHMENAIKSISVGLNENEILTVIELFKKFNFNYWETLIEELDEGIIREKILTNDINYKHHSSLILTAIRKIAGEVSDNDCLETVAALDELSIFKRLVFNNMFICETSWKNSYEVAGANVKEFMKEYGKHILLLFGEETFFTIK